MVADSLRSLLFDLVRRPWRAPGPSHLDAELAEAEWLAPAALAERSQARLRQAVWHALLEAPAWRARLLARVSPAGVEGLASPEALPVVAHAELPDGPAEDTLARRQAVERRAARWAGAPPARLHRAHDAAGVEAARRSRWPVTLLAPPACLPAPVENGAPSRLAALLAPAGITTLVCLGPDGDGAAARYAASIGARCLAWWADERLGLLAAGCDAAPPGAMHVMADRVWLEILDEAGRPVPPGAPGQAVATDLDAREAPWLRVTVGARARLLLHLCACGRAFPLVERLAAAD
jgi:hypothetical protein